MRKGKLDFVRFLASRSRGSALQILHFFAKFIAEGAIYEQKNEEFASDSLGDTAIKLYKVEVKREFSMLQENPFFSQPIIFFGSHEDSEENEEGDFAENWQISIQTERNSLHQPSIGLFFHWFAPIE